MKTPVLVHLTQGKACRWVEWKASVIDSNTKEASAPKMTGVFVTIFFRELLQNKAVFWKAVNANPVLKVNQSVFLHKDDFDCFCFHVVWD